MKDENQTFFFDFLSARIDEKSRWLNFGSRPVAARNEPESLSGARRHGAPSA